MTNNDTKMLLRTARTYDQADNILSRTWCRSVNDKIAYLYQLFPEELNNIEPDPTEDTRRKYQSLIMAVIHSEQNEPFMWGYKEGCKNGRKDGYIEAVHHVIKDWNVLRKLSQEGIKEHFSRIIHGDAEDIYASSQM